MPTPLKIKKAGGWSSIAYTFKKARESGGTRAMYRALRTRNTCKTCAVGMGGQAGGMVNESGHFPEFCKKSVQAMAADMQPAISESFWRSHSIDRLKNASPKELEAFGRLSEPVIFRRGEGCYRPVSWDSALETIASKLVTIHPNESFFYLSGRSSNEAGFLLQLFARLYGTNNVNNCSYYCHQASGVGMTSVIGTGTATVVLEDLDKADLVFVIGANPASNHPRLMKPLMRVRRRGGNVIIVNPIRESGLESFSIPSDARSLLFGSKIASVMVQPNIGGDLAFLYGVAKSLQDAGRIDHGFLSKHTRGSAELLEHISRLTWDEIELGSGVSRSEIELIAQMYAHSERCIFSWAMGVTHHARGTETVQMIAALALMRGMIGRPGCGLMPIRGHSNVQGIGSVGVTPELKQAIFDSLESKYKLNLPRSPGLDTMACMEGIESGHLKAGFCLGGNLYGSNPDAVFAGAALSKLELLVTLSTTLNTGHAWALAEETIILPVLPRDEEPMPTTQESMFNFVRLSDGGEPRIDGPRSEVSVIADLANRVANRVANGVANRVANRVANKMNTESASDGISGASEELAHTLRAVDWAAMNDTEAIRSMIAETVPGWSAISNIDETKEEFQIEGRTFHSPSFATPDARARLFVHSLPELKPLAPKQFRLMTIRSEGQFNTVVYEEYDLFRGAPCRDVVLIHPDDILSLGAGHGQRVRIEGPAGRLPNFQLIAFDRIKQGNVAMYFPEANVLLDRSVDKKSRTPAFKGAIVSIFI